MKAPVYRNIEGRNTFLGLTFPGEALAVLSALWLLLTTFPPRWAVPLGIALYATVRLAGRRRAPKYLQHWLVLWFRRRFQGGRLSAVARAIAPKFRYADYDWREAPPRRPLEVRGLEVRESRLPGPGEGNALTPNRLTSDAPSRRGGA